MAENRPPRRSGHHGAKSAEHYPNDRERIDRARQTAEALFAPKPRSAAPPVSPGDPASERSVAKPRILRSSQAAPVPQEAVADAPIASRPPVGPQIPATQFGRIRTWLKYGMTASQVAQLYGVPVAEVERVLRQP
jgi:hypothetical protein